MCRSCGGSVVRTMRVTSASNTGRGYAPSRQAYIPLVTITDDLLFRWAKIIQIANAFPIMHTVRALEYTISTTECRTCHKKTAPKVDRSLLQTVRRLLGECSDEKARLVKEAARVVNYRVQYLDLTGQAKDITR